MAEVWLSKGQVHPPVAPDQQQAMKLVLLKKRGQKSIEGDSVEDHIAEIRFQKILAFRDIQMISEFIRFLFILYCIRYIKLWHRIGQKSFDSKRRWLWVALPLHMRYKENTEKKLKRLLFDKWNDSTLRAN